MHDLYVVFIGRRAKIYNHEYALVTVYLTTNLRRLGSTAFDFAAPHYQVARADFVDFVDFCS
jgi:hypothetical protein